MRGQNRTYYYWDDCFYNKNGLSLRDCYNRYGLGKQQICNDALTMEVIFLDESKSFGNSWALRVYDRQNKNVPLRLYEKDKIYGKFIY
jgi:hypothetical protein